MKNEQIISEINQALDTYKKANEEDKNTYIFALKTNIEINKEVLRKIKVLRGIKDGRGRPKIVG